MDNTGTAHFYQGYGESVGVLNSPSVKKMVKAFEYKDTAGVLEKDATDVQAFRNVLPPVSKAGRSGPLESETFETLQKWLGVVVSVDEEDQEFRARLMDKTNPEHPDEEVTLSMNDVSVSDLGFLQSGSVFSWSIGYGINKVGTKVKQSVLHFSRLKGFSTSDYKESKVRASELEELFSGH